MSIDPNCSSLLCNKNIYTKKQALKALQQMRKTDPTSSSLDFKSISKCLPIFDDKDTLKNECEQKEQEQFRRQRPASPPRSSFMSTPFRPAPTQQQKASPLAPQQQQKAFSPATQYYPKQYNQPPLQKQEYTPPSWLRGNSQQRDAKAQEEIRATNERIAKQAREEEEAWDKEQARLREIRTKKYNPTGGNKTKRYKKRTSNKRISKKSNKKDKKN